MENSTINELLEPLDDQLADLLSELTSASTGVGTSIEQCLHDVGSVGLIWTNPSAFQTIHLHAATHAASFLLSDPLQSDHALQSLIWSALANYVGGKTCRELEALHA